MTNNWIRTTAANSAMDHRVLFLRFTIPARLCSTMLFRSGPLPNGHLPVGSDQRRGKFRRIHDSRNTAIYLPWAHIRTHEDVQVCRVIITTALERRPMVKTPPSEQTVVMRCR